MSIVLFEGPAGTGKTWSLRAEARAHITACPLNPEQRVLALTKYHGSRRRMDAKLRGSAGVGNKLDCLTIDGFAWRLLRRWRSLASRIGLSPIGGDYVGTMRAAGKLLARENVAAWVTRRYPIIVVDETQDCRGGEIAVLDALEPGCRILCAADAFQDLSGNEGQDALSWVAAKKGEVRPLSVVRRTEDEGLLQAAVALRNRSSLPTGSPAFKVQGVPKAPLAGGTVSWFIKSCRKGGSSVAVISPTGPAKSAFARNVVDWVSTKTAKTSRGPATAGPYSIDWEAIDEDRRRALTSDLALPDDHDAQVLVPELEAKAREARALDVADWLRRLRCVAGRQRVVVSEVTDQIERVVSRRRAFGRADSKRRIATTVHQAKNREFDFVVVLWPLAIVPDPEMQQRLLYNAVTRAVGRVVVLVEDPKGNRLSQRPFA